MCSLFDVLIMAYPGLELGRLPLGHLGRIRHLLVQTGAEVLDLRIQGSLQGGRDQEPYKCRYYSAIMITTCSLFDDQEPYKCRYYSVVLKISCDPSPAHSCTHQALRGYLTLSHPHGVIMVMVSP